jgi:hypothetical protein
MCHKPQNAACALRFGSLRLPSVSTTPATASEAAVASPQGVLPSTNRFSTRVSRSSPSSQTLGIKVCRASFSTLVRERHQATTTIQHSAHSLLSRASRILLLLQSGLGHVASSGQPVFPRRAQNVLLQAPPSTVSAPPSPPDFLLAVLKSNAGPQGRRKARRRRPVRRVAVVVALPSALSSCPRVHLCDGDAKCTTAGPVRANNAPF